MRISTNQSAALLLALVLPVAFVISSGGYAQALLSKTFAVCMKTVGSYLYWYIGAAIAAIGLYFYALSNLRARQLYLGLQVLFAGLAAWQIALVFGQHPRTLAVIAGLAVAPALLVAAASALRAGNKVRTFLGLATDLDRLTLSALLAAILFAAAITPRLVFWDAPIRYREIMLALAVAIAASAALIGCCVRSEPLRLFDRLATTPPIAILLFALARAKLPDQSFDGMLYKATLPLQIADWRTATSAAIDHSLLGTNFQEFLNAGLRLLATDYDPRFISTLALIGAFLLAASAFRVRDETPGRFWRALGAVSVLCVSEAANGQGAAMQEATLMLLVIASLLRTPLWPIFLAAAAATKLTLIFLAPLVIVLQAPEILRRPRAALAALAIPLALGAVIFGTQIERNLFVTGRVLGISETLAGVTDPPSPTRYFTDASITLPAAMGFTTGTNPREITSVRGGLANNMALSLCNIVALDVICPITFNGQPHFGFHVFPSSRAAALSVFASVILLLLALTRRVPAYNAASAAAALLVFVLLASFISEGRHFLPLSLSFGLLLLHNSTVLADLFTDPHGRWRVGAAAFGAFICGADLAPGVMTNVSWYCDRQLHTPDRATDWTPRLSAEAVFTRGLADRYRAACRPPGLPSGPPPVVFIQNGVKIAPYDGIHRIPSIISHDLNLRFLNVAPERRQGLSTSVLAFVYTDEGFARTLAGDQFSRYAPCYEDGDVKIACSKDLQPFGQQCARSLLHNRTLGASAALAQDEAVKH